MTLLRLAATKVSLYFLLLTFGVAAVFAIGLLGLFVASSPLTGLLVGLVSAILIVVLIQYYRRVQRRAFYLGIGTVFVVSRLLLIVLIPIVPQGDSLRFRQLGLTMMVSPGDCRPFAMGYPLTLNLYYRLIGDSVLLTQLMHIGLGVISLALLYAIGQRLGSERASKLAVLLFTFWPSQWVMTSLVVSEHVAVVLLLVTVWCVLSYQTDRQTPLYLLGAGACIALAFAARTPTVMALPAALLTVLFVASRRALLHALILLVAFGVTYQAFQVVLRMGYGVEYLSQSAGWSLLVGTNVEHGGIWVAQDDEDQMDEQMRLTGCAAANQWAFNQGVHRVVDQPLQFGMLFFIKIVNLWSDDTYAVRYLPPAISWIGLTLLQEVYYAGLLLALVWSLIRLRARFDRRAWMPLLFLAALALLHVFLEVQQRYHFIAVPMMIMVIVLPFKGAKAETLVKKS